ARARLVKAARQRFTSSARVASGLLPRERRCDDRFEPTLAHPKEDLLPMKKLALPLALVFATGALAAAQAPPPKPADTTATEARKPAKTHKFDTEIVSADV